MKLNFSQRKGLLPIKVELERDGISGELRNTLWNYFFVDIYGPIAKMHYSVRDDLLKKFFYAIWIGFFKKAVDEIPVYRTGSINADATVLYIKEWFFKVGYNRLLDFIEFLIMSNSKRIDDLNSIFEDERSAYRIVNEIIIEIDSKEEVAEIQSAIDSAPNNSVQTHLKAAMDLYSNRSNPDYRNSIKESISAIESLAKIIIKNDKATLGQALTEIEKKHKIPNALKTAFSSLYGYTSDSGGIRHSLSDGDIAVGKEEARFMLVCCSAFVNYLKSKM
jgi:hypothetical protein